jgi:hypothetical protein
MPTRLPAVRPCHRATVAVEDSVLEYNSVRNRYYSLHGGGSLLVVPRNDMIFDNLLPQ